MINPSSSTPAPLSDLLEQIVKHTVRYADHRAVSRNELIPMMRHDVEMKDQYPMHCCCIGWETCLIDKTK